jgi:hypothetical protein
VILSSDFILVHTQSQAAFEAVQKSPPYFVLLSVIFIVLPSILFIVLPNLLFIFLPSLLFIVLPSDSEASLASFGTMSLGVDPSGGDPSAYASG